MHEQCRQSRACMTLDETITYDTPIGIKLKTAQYCTIQNYILLTLSDDSIGELICNPLSSDGEPIKLPENLESLPRAEHFAAQRHRWNTNEVSHLE